MLWRQWSMYAIWLKPSERGSTTRQEAEAGRYAARVLREAGLEPVIETFVSARSSYYPYALFAGLILAGEMLFWLGGRWGAAAALALTLFAIVSGVLELAFRPNPLRWLLPKGKSQNVFAWICPQSEVREQVVLLGHLDSNRTPLLFSSDGWVRFLGIIVPLCLISAVLLMVLFAIGIMAPGLAWRLVSLPCALPILVLWLLMLQADLTPYSAGANDNATAAGVVRAWQSDSWRIR